ncbi:MAG: class I SAM-dependent methyltransferase [Candidatus Pacearchaeota archaeon]|nr:class I SAM-dependent methyltransferase [Candidatus Pacearchaeota archaeon]
MPKDRGIEHIERYFGDFTKLVAKKIKKQGKVKILDAGCGFGVAMMGFIKIFWDKVEIVGYNYSKKDGNLETMKKEAIEKKIFTKEEVDKIKNLPKILYIDASQRLPFPDNTFDFIYSMASVYLYDDKIHFLEECNRILKKDGIARISVAFFEHKKRYLQRKGSKKKVWITLPEHYRYFWEVWDKGKEVKIWNYCKRIKGLKVVGKNKESKQYLEIRKQPKLDFKLQFVSAVDLNFIWKKFGGIKSIYTTQKKFKPRWKVK